MASTLVDIIPKYDPTGHMMKIKDSDLYNLNNKVSTILNLLEFSQGQSGIFPYMGGYQELQAIPFTENLNITMIHLQQKLSKFIYFPISFSYEKSSADKEIVVINIEIDNLPGKIAFNLNTKGNFVKIINPRYLKK
jgi:hypothetical protein